MPPDNRLLEKRRICLLGVLFLTVLAVLLARIYHVQLAHTEKHLQAVRNQSIRRIRLSPVRGQILASDGNTVLAGNKAAYHVILRPTEMRQPGPRSNTVKHIRKQLDRIKYILNRSTTLSSKKIKRHLRINPALPIRAFENLDAVELARVSEILPEIRGMSVQTKLQRKHSFPKAMSHVLGFTGHRHPSGEDIREEFSYVKPQLVGRAGLEKTFNEQLQGSGGTKLVRVNTLGFVHETLNVSEQPRRGNDLILSIDVEAQKIASELIQGREGAIVVLNARNGAVLAMTSSPSYHLDKLSSKRYKQLAEDEKRRPLNNRAIRAQYLPGSIVKPLVGLAALNAGTITPGTRFTCRGRHEKFDIGCWLETGHGNIDLIEALEHSCNTYFINAGVETGMKSIKRMLQSCNLGRRPGIPLPYAGKGVIPSAAWIKRNTDRSSWLPVDTAYMSIGQQAINLSPLQAALYTAAIANGGTVYEPYLVKAIRNPNGTIIRKAAAQPQNTIDVNASHLQTIQKGMYEVVNSSSGTAKRAQNRAISLAGKTGTAEVIRPGKPDYNNTWFVCYGPVKNPQYAMAILVEDGDSGGKTAAPLAGRFFARWLSAADANS